MRFTAVFTRVSRSGSIRIRSSASGCSLEITRMRAPPFRIAGVSGECISPSKVTSTTTSQEANA